HGELHPDMGAQSDLARGVRGHEVVQGAAQPQADLEALARAEVVVEVPGDLEDAVGERQLGGPRGFGVEEGEQILDRGNVAGAGQTDLVREYLGQVDHRGQAAADHRQRVEDRPGAGEAELLHDAGQGIDQRAAAKVVEVGEVVQPRDRDGRGQV